MKTFRCGDVVPNCTKTFSAETEDGIFQQVAHHARVDHGMTSIPDGVLEKVRGCIHEVPAA